MTEIKHYNLLTVHFSEFFKPTTTESVGFAKIKQLNSAHKQSHNLNQSP